MVADPKALQYIMHTSGSILSTEFNSLSTDYINRLQFPEASRCGSNNQTAYWKRDRLGIWLRI